jgi:tetratricopeptide (TPR) repeat protein
MGKKKPKRTATSAKKPVKKPPKAQTHPAGSPDKSTSQRFTPGIIAAIFLLALVLRLLFVSQVTSTPIFHGLAIDTAEYADIALQLMRGNLTPPNYIYLNSVYPFFLAMVYLILGSSPLPIIIIQAILDSISCALVYHLSGRVFNKHVATVAGIAYALYGIAIFYTGLQLATTVVIFLSLLMTSFLIFAKENKKMPVFFVSGLIFGLLVFGRPNVILFLAVLPFWFFTTIKEALGKRKCVHGLVFFALGFLIVTSFFSIRNYSFNKQLSPFSVQGGLNFYIGNTPRAQGHLMSPEGVSLGAVKQVRTSIQQARRESGQDLTPSQASRYWLFKGLRFIKDNPVETFWLYVKKLATFWRKEEISLNIDYSLSRALVPILRLPLVGFGVVAPFGLLGLFLSIRNRRNTLLITLFVLSYMVSVIIFFVSARYRLPVVPFLIMFSSYGLYYSLGVVRASEAGPKAFLGVFIILLFLGVNYDFALFRSAVFSQKTHYLNLGLAYQNAGNLDKAAYQIRRALSVGEPQAKEYGALGIVYYRKGRIREAIEQYRKALKLNPDFVEVNNNLGVAYLAIGDVDAAIEVHKKTLTMDPQWVTAHVNLGMALVKKGMLDEAISQYKTAIDIDPNHAVAHRRLKAALMMRYKLKQ